MFYFHLTLKTVLTRYTFYGLQWLISHTFIFDHKIPISNIKIRGNFIPSAMLETIEHSNIG